MKLTKKFCFKGVAALLAVIALIMGFFSGMSFTESGVTTKAQLFGMMFGKWNITISGSKLTGNESFDGPLALSGLFAFILIIVAIIVLVLAIFLEKDDKKLLLIGAILLAASALFMFLLLAFGTDYTEEGLFGTTSTAHYADYVKGYALGAGAWLWAIFALGGAGAAGYAYLKL